VDINYKLFAFVILLSGCSVAQSEPTATLFMTDTQLSPTATITPTTKSTFTATPSPTITNSPTSTFTPSPTSTPKPITVLEWPFDTSVPIASVNFFDHDKLSRDTHIEDWIDNRHLVTFNCIEVQWPNNNLDRYMAFYRDRSTKNEVLFSDKHGGLDLNFPVGTPLISRWNTEIYTEGDLNVVFLLNDGKLTLKLGHIDYFSAGFERSRHYQVRPGDIVGYVKEGNGYTMTHPSTGSTKYTEIHFEIALIKPSEHVVRGNYNGGTHYVVDGLVGDCNPDPYVRWITGLDELTWVNGSPPEFGLLQLLSGYGTQPIKFEIMSDADIEAWNRSKNK